MRQEILKAIFIIAISVISTWANAQKAYRCGNSYSQTPCADGKALDLMDNRTAAQQKQAAAANSNRAEDVAALEKARIAREKRELTAKKAPAAVIAPAAAPPGAPAKSDKARAKLRKKAAADLAATESPKKKVKQKSKTAKTAKIGDTQEFKA